MTIPGSAIPLLLSQAGDTQHKIEKSLRFDGGDDASLSKTFASGGSTTTWTLSFWIKGHDLAQACYVFTGGTGTSSYITMDVGQFRFYSSGHDLKTNARYRDPAAWYHFVVVANTKDSTTNDRTKVYVNGTRLAVADFATHTQPSQNAALGDFGSAATHYINKLTTGNEQNMMLADVYFIDGYIKEASDFGETDEATGQWVPKEYADSMAEVTSVIPTGYTYWAGMNETWDGTSTTTSAGSDFIDLALPSDTKVYWEVTIQSPANYRQIGFLTGASGTGTNYDNNVRGYYINNAPSGVFLNQSGSGRAHSSAIGVSFATGDTLMYAWDPINDKIYFGHNGTWLDSADPVAGTNAQITGDDLSSGSWYFKQGRTTHDTGAGTTQTNVTQASSLYYQETLGGNSSHLKFNGTDLGEDSSGNDNDWTATNLTPASTTLNVPCVDFDNDEDVLLIPDHADLGFGSGDFTVECFINPRTPGSNTYQHIAGQSRGTTANSSSSWAFNLYTQTNGTSQVMFYFYHGANANYANTGYILNSGKWYHIVGTRDGDDLRIYVDGVHQSSIDVSSYAAMNDSAYAFRIGSDDAGSYDLKGSISNLRVVKGTCLYPDGTTFTVPSRPLANVTNTKLLCCQSSTSVKASTVVPYTAPNDGRIWSDATTSNLLRAASGFNNDVGWYAETTAADAIGSITFNPAIPISSITSFKVNAQSNGSNSQNWGFNGGSLTARVCNGATDMTDLLPGSGNLTSMELQKTGSGVALFNEILINDVVLTDSIAVYGNRNDPEATTKSDDTTDDDVSTDTPTPFDDEGNGTGNYATWNPLRSLSTFAQGNLAVTSHSSGTYNTTATTLGMTSGKWYCEMTPSATGGTNNAYGIINDSTLTTTYLGATTGTDSSMGLWDNGGTYRNGSYTDTSYCSAFQTGGEVVGLAFDVDNGTLKFYINGVDQGNAWTDIPAGTWHFCVTTYQTTTTEITLNCGQRAFAFAPPSGYKALNTYNLPDPTIKDPSKHFDIKLYTGNSWALANTAIDTSTAYRYHRILCEGDNSGGAISEIQFFDSSGLIDASDANNAGSTVDSNENQSGSTSLAAWTAFDGTLGGADYTEGVRKDPSTGFYISKDWGSGNTKTITSVKIWGVNSYGIAGNTASKYVKLQGSSDDSTWTDLCTWNSGRTDSFSNTSTIPVHVSDQRGIVDGLNFSPDFVWFKQRTGSQYHMVADAVRGGTKQLYPHTTDAETTYANHETTFTSTGVEVSTSNTQNQGGESHIMWAWDGGTANTSASVGEFNSATYDTSEDWSANTSNNAGNTTDPGQAFRGILTSTGVGVATTFVNLTDVTFSVSSTISLWIHNPAGISVIMEYNGTEYTNTSPTDFGWTDFTVPSSTNSGTLKVKLASSGDECRGVMIDGKILVDDNVTPPDLPSLVSTYRTNPNAGFSIVTATGSSSSAGTVAHGLNASPDLIIAKLRETAGNGSNQDWQVYHQSLGNTKGLQLNLTDDTETSSSLWNNIPTTSNVFSIGASSRWDGDFVAYCWSEVAGYSKFGTYIGNADVDGPMVWCGFKPRWIMLKNSETDSRRWVILDSARQTSNGPDNGALWANQDDAESVNSENNIDYLSNGFKLKCTNGNANESGDTFVFAAFAESPFKYSNAS